LADLKKNRTAIKTSLRVKDEAMAWINSPECEVFCDALDADYKAIREQAMALYRRFLEEADGCPRRFRFRRKKMHKAELAYKMPY
jgi:hypothetical protein